MSPPKAQNKTPVHIEVIRITFLNTGLFMGSLTPQFMHDLGMLLGKYRVRHIEAVLIPCTTQHTVKFEMETKNGKGDGEDPGGVLKP